MQNWYKTEIPRHLVGNVQAQIIDAIAHTVIDVNDFQSGDHYAATLHIINTVSLLTLSILEPWGGDASDAINVGGAFATAYVYGFFWGM